MQKLWTAVDDYIVEKLAPPDDILAQALAASDAAGLPAINVAPNQGKLLMLLARMAGARRVLEIGTLGGYSTIWLARALPPDGHLVTLESEASHAEVARSNIARAGFEGLVDLRLGPALASLAELKAEGVEPFDFIFIDADKPNNPHYLDWALAFSKTGTVIVADNVVRDGAVIDPAHPDPRVQGVRATYDWFAGEPRITATAVQTVGSKGYDGFAIGLVTG